MAQEQPELEWLRRRFARAPPLAGTIYGDQGTRPGGDALHAASVLVPIVARGAEPTVLFTQRTAHLKNHSGQISFPGGRAEAHDASPERTALRETWEEIGLVAERIEVVGRLSEYHTRTGYRITPVVGIVKPPFDLRPDDNEVAEVFEVPLAFLLDARNHQRHSREFEGEQRHYFAIPYQDRYIWGATAGMLVNLYRYLTNV
ncbi:MAG: CoA pyrophosphatase [Betaproteobacteria bacterium]|nr:CoA pyrophosphatase [Betaproteobacteria bacterium]